MPGGVYPDIYQRPWHLLAAGRGTNSEKLSTLYNTIKMDGYASSQSSLHSRNASRSSPSKLLHKRPSWWTRASLDNWAWELSAASLCICILAAIAAILFAYDNRPVPDLPEGLTVSSFGGYFVAPSICSDAVPPRSTRSFHSLPVLQRPPFSSSWRRLYDRRSGCGLLTHRDL